MRIQLTSDEGTATISIAIMFPVIGLLFLTLAQATMIAAAHDVALSAAEEGLRVARAHHGTLIAGQAAAVSFARREPVLLGPQIAASGTTKITMTVRGHALSLLPGIHPAVSAVAHGAREIFTTDRHRFTNSDRSQPRTHPGTAFDE